LELLANSFQIALGLLLRVLCGLLGVGIRLQLMDGLVQALSFLPVSNLAAGYIGTGMHARHVGAETIEIHSEIVAGVKSSKASLR
jgi:hypothetical protein